MKNSITNIIEFYKSTPQLKKIFNNDKCNILKECLKNSKIDVPENFCNLVSKNKLEKFAEELYDYEKNNLELHELVSRDYLILFESEIKQIENIIKNNLHYTELFEIEKYGLLIDSVMEQNTRFVKFLLSHGVKISHPDFKDTNLIEIATNNNNKDIVKMLVKAKLEK